MHHQDDAGAEADFSIIIKAILNGPISASQGLLKAGDTLVQVQKLFENPKMHRFACERDILQPSCKLQVISLENKVLI